MVQPYRPDGAVIVSVTGSAGKEAEITDTYSVLYARFEPSLAEKTHLGMNQQKRNLLILDCADSWSLNASAKT